MTEQKLKEYFENSLTAEQLSVDLQDSQRKTGHDVTTVYIDKIPNDEFEVKIEHLLKLCSDTINGHLSTTDINTIAFSLICSDFFHWDNKTTDGKKIENTIFDWDNPDIGFDLTIKNFELWKEYLLTGNYKLDNDELKRKFRNDGKTRKKNGL